MTIQPNNFDLLFYTIVLLAGVDFTLSGWLALKKGIVVLEKPKSLGILILRVMNKSYENSKKLNKSLWAKYSFTNLRVSLFISGILIMGSSLLLILDALK